MSSSSINCKKDTVTMPFFSNLKKVLNLGASGSDSGSLSGGKKKKAALAHLIRVDQDPELTWEIIGELGDGAFGKVQKVRHREKPEVLAAAKICILESDEELDDFMVEIDILSNVSHRNVIKLYEAYFYQNKLWVRDVIPVTKFISCLFIVSFQPAFI